MPLKMTAAADTAKPEAMAIEIEIDVLFKCPSWKSNLPAAEPICRRAALAAIQSVFDNGDDPLEFSIVLADDEFVQALNREFRGQDNATNVLSFPADASDVPENFPKPLGDIILAYETTKAEATADGKELTDHLSHLVVHGVLHLLGADHQNDAEAKEMERREISILAGLGIADPQEKTE